jgi:hypothetical protein
MYLQKDISIIWKEWTDDLAGVESYEYEVFYLQFNGGSLTERNKALGPSHHYM